MFVYIYIEDWCTYTYTYTYIYIYIFACVHALSSVWFIPHDTYCRAVVDSSWSLGRPKYLQGGVPLLDGCHTPSH